MVRSFIHRGAVGLAIAVHATVVAPSVARAEEPPRFSDVQPSASDDSGSTRKLVGLALGEVGLAGLVAGTLFGIRASASWSSAHDECPSASNCPNHAQALSDHDRASSFATVSTIGLAVGLLGLSSGAYLFFTPSSSTKAQALVTLSPAIGPREGSLRLQGTF
jgi:hypothetical protein